MQSKNIDIDMRGVAETSKTHNAMRTNVFTGRSQVESYKQSGDYTLPEPAPSQRRVQKSRLKSLWRRRGRLSSTKLLSLSVIIVLIVLLFISLVGFDLHYINTTKTTHDP